MIKTSNPNYFHDTSVLRATQSWQQESNTEKELSNEYKLFIEQIKREIGDLYAQYGDEGFLNYSELQKLLTPAQLVQYRAIIQNLISQFGNELDEELLLELMMLTQYKKLNILDSKLNIVHAYLLVVINNNIELASKSLSETYNHIYNHTLYDSHRKIGYILPFEKLNKDKMMDTILSDWSGDNFIDAIKHGRHKLIRDMRKTIVKGIRRNESYKKLIDSLIKLVGGGKGYKHTLSILRGESARIIAETTAQAYEQAGLEKYEFIATLDDRTTKICRDMDRKVFYLKDMEVGVNCNPMHYGCRSTIAGYIEDDDMAELERIARDPNSGENYKVSADMSYEEWNKKYNK